MSRADGHLPSWARRLYKAAPRRAIVKVDAERSAKPCRIDACAYLECGHTRLVKLPAQVEVGRHEDNGAPITHYLDTLTEDRCRTLLPSQRCEQCQIDRYPELDVLMVSGRVDEGHFRYTPAIAARIDDHENGRAVAPVADDEISSP